MCLLNVRIRMWQRHMQKKLTFTNSIYKSKPAFNASECCLEFVHVVLDCRVDLFFALLGVFGISICIHIVFLHFYILFLRHYVIIIIFFRRIANLQFFVLEVERSSLIVAV